MRISLQPAFILHHRDYRETSLLLDVITQDYGRMSFIARGIRTSRSKLKPILQPFCPLLISWQGRSELMTLHSAESQGVPIHLQGECLLSAFYLNELLVRLLQKHDPHPQLYTIYANTLLELAGSGSLEKHLRLFEKKLLEQLGYGLQLGHPIDSTHAFQSDRLYRLYPEQGFQLSEGRADEPQSLLFSGKSLLALSSEQLEDAESLRDAKRLMRISLGALLGSQPLQSRKLFAGVMAE